jgi:hypothetical protein
MGRNVFSPEWEPPYPEGLPFELPVPGETYHSAFASRVPLESVIVEPLSPEVREQSAEVPPYLA